MRALNLPPLTMHLPARHGLGKAAWVLTLFLHIVPTSAQAANQDASSINGCKADKVLRFRGLTARLENDLFAGTAQNYTNGVAFTAVSHDIADKLRTECLPTPVRLHAKLIKFMNPGFWSDAQNVVVKFGQPMFTPKDSARTDLILDDRPYAGLLYVGMSWNRRKHQPQSNSEILDTREITLGIIGPLVLAEQAQNLVHGVIGAEKFKNSNLTPFFGRPAGQRTRKVMIEPKNIRTTSRAYLAAAGLVEP